MFVLSVALVAATDDATENRLSFSESCEVKLRKAKLWDAARWNFAPEVSVKGVRVVWAHPRARCYENHSFFSPEIGAPPPLEWEEAGCVPINEWDFVWRELLSEAPLAGRIGVGVCDGDVEDVGHGMALIPGDHSDLTTLADGALYVVHLAPWSPVEAWRALDLLARALDTCDSKRALLHLSDESGSLDISYRLWPLVVRIAYRVKIYCAFFTLCCVFGSMSSA